MVRKLVQKWYESWYRSGTEVVTEVVWYRSCYGSDTEVVVTEVVWHTELAGSKNFLQCSVAFIFQTRGVNALSPRIRRDSCMSLGITVTRLACMAHKFESSNKPTM